MELFQPQRYASCMNFTSSPTSFSSVGHTNASISFNNNTTALVPVGQQSNDPKNRRARRHEAKIHAKEQRPKSARYLNATEKQKLASERAKQHFFGPQRHNTGEQQSPSSANSTLPIDGADSAERPPTLSHERNFMIGSLSHQAWNAFSSTWKWISGSQRIEASGGEDDKELARYKDLVGQLRDKGVKKIILAETHYASANIALIAGTVSGANQGGEGISYYREIQEKYERDLQTTADKDLVFQTVLKHIVLDPANAAGPEVDMLREELTSSRRVEVKPLSFQNPSRMDMREFVKHDGFDIASMGTAHAMFEFAGKDTVLVPWMGLIMANPAYKAPRFSERVQKDMLDGFAKAQKKAPTVLILQSQAWAIGMKREDIYRYYNEDKGLVVVELPLSPSVNASIIAPPSLLDPLKLFAAQHHGRVWILCKGIEGCETEQEPTSHDEF
ncbi:hypothetical protein [Variovorax sp. DT-64]|uniref:hypothetical protein n=1 Tax=Variovorax sp. DT-64 TaxID=3396160 RepID=UPI003F1CEA34